MDRLIPLDILSSRETGFVRSLHGGHSFVSRLAALGFTPGVPVTIVQNRGHGPLIVQVRDCRIALGRGEAQKVLVQREDHHNDPTQRS